jgi:surface antigen
MRRVALAALLALTIAAPARGSRSSLIVYGYPYTSRCPGAGIAEVVDRWHMYACNCTSYVAWALTANGQRTDWFVPGSMDAWNWPNVARLAHLTVDTHPAVGAVVVWPRLSKPFGHVAYVTGVQGHNIDVAEYNLPQFGANTFIFDTRDDVPTAGAVFIHVPRRGTPTP